LHEGEGIEEGQSPSQTPHRFSSTVAYADKMLEAGVGASSSAEQGDKPDETESLNQGKALGFLFFFLPGILADEGDKAAATQIGNYILLSLLGDFI